MLVGIGFSQLRPERVWNPDYMIRRGICSREILQHCEVTVTRHTGNLFSSSSTGILCSWCAMSGTVSLPTAPTAGATDANVMMVHGSLDTSIRNDTRCHQESVANTTEVCAHIVFVETQNILRRRSLLSIKSFHCTSDEQRL